MPGLEFERNINRYMLPVRCVAFSPSGSSIAVAGDEDGIRLLNMADTKARMHTLAHAVQSFVCPLACWYMHGAPHAAKNMHSISTVCPLFHGGLMKCGKSFCSKHRGLTCCLLA